MSNSSIWPIDRILSGATTPSQSGPGSNGNEGVFHIPHSSTDWSLNIRLFSVISRTLVEGWLALCRDASSVFFRNLLLLNLLYLEIWNVYHVLNIYQYLLIFRRWFVRWEIQGHTAIVLKGAVSKICSM